VNLDRIPAELGQLAGDAIIPAGTDGHDEIAVSHRLVGVGSAVHAQHPEVQRLILRHRTLASRVVTTGACSFSASWRMARPASEATAPWPT